MWSPGTASSTGSRSPADLRVNVALASGPSSTSSARTSAPGSRPKVITAASVSSAYARATGSSAFMIAVPSAPSHSTGSDPARTIASHDPKIPRCAVPTFVTTTASGRATSQSNRTSPSRRAPISATTTSTPRSAPSSVIGSPTSLLNDAGLAWVRRRVPTTAAARSLTEVFPFEPVIPTTRVPVMRSRSSAARSSSARPVCGTSITVPSIPGRCTSAATAPREIASPTNA